MREDGVPPMRSVASEASSKATTTMHAADSFDCRENKICGVNLGGLC